MEKQFIVSARKYRPDSFETVIGQPSITRTLKNAIAGNHLAHAYLFTGPRGVGKTTCARIFAKTINCSNLTSDTEACNVCEACLTFQESRSFNIHELDAASNNHVEDIRNLIEQVRIPPQMGKYSVYIIDEVHMLSQAAFNAFLKTLEEPPAHAIFILATTEKHKILPTILSRCQVFDFHRIQIRDIIAQLQRIADKEGIATENSALNIIAQKADGAMRDALSIFDQVVSFCGTEVTYQQVIDHLNVLDYEYYFQLTELFLAGEFKQALLVFNRILEEGFDGHNFISGLSTHFRDLLVSRDPQTIELLEVGEEIGRRYQQMSSSCSINFLYEGLKILNGCDLSFKQAKDPRLMVELALMSLARIQEMPAETPKPAIKPAIQPQSQQVPPRSPKGQMTRLSDLQPRKLVPTEISATIPVPPELKKEQKEPDELTGTLLKSYWMEFAEQLKDDQPRLYSTLTTQIPDLSPDKKIILKLNNPLQEKAIRSIQTELLQFLRDRSGHSDLEIQTAVPEEHAEKKLYTQEEKYQHLQKKNPDLDLFRQSLNLELE
ncbi:MAG: DNA polymerase III subunit gamma/tau [Porphyromonadaceae bacterium]|nr:MAG: DNA polymerase III subunit gamma/tau [Porphyromonadaceae bacterium]